MNKLSKAAAIIAGAGLIGLAGVGATLAQPAPGAGAPGREAMMQRHQEMMQRHQTRMAERLRAVLQLRQDQEPALQALLTALKPEMRTHERRVAPGEAPPERERLTTPQRLDRQAARMAERQQRFQARSEAIKRFYGQLSAAQQRAFDEMGPLMGRGGPRGHRMMGPGGQGHDGPGGRRVIIRRHIEGGPGGED